MVYTVRANMASRRSSMAVRAIFRVRLSPPPIHSSIRSSLSNPQIRISSSPSRVLRRELSSFRPFHAAIASACLVSKLSSNATSFFEGRFINYVSPI